MTKISFPGIGIGEFDLPEVLLSFGENFKIYWSAVFMAIAVIISIFKTKKTVNQS